VNRSRPSALDAALSYLGRSERSEAEIRKFLSEKSYSDSEITDGIAALIWYGYLDDQGLAKRIVESKKQRLVGDLAIEQTLQAKGLDVTVSTADASSRAQKLLRAKFATDADTHDMKFFAKAARLLASRGFREEEIQQALESHFRQFES